LGITLVNITEALVMSKTTKMRFSLWEPPTQLSVARDSVVCFNVDIYMNKEGEGERCLHEYTSARWESEHHYGVPEKQRAL